MSEKSQKKPSTKKATPTTSVHQEQDEAQHLLGNSFLNTQLQNAGQKADDVINDLISEKSIQKYARSIVDSAAGSLKNFLKSNVDAQDHDAASMFSNAIRGEMRNYSDAIMMDAGVAQKISGFLSENKFLVITAALGAAVKYVLDNEKLPELKKEFELGGGHSISTSIDIGTTLDIAVREIELGYRYSADRFRASFGAQHSLEYASLLSWLLFQLSVKGPRRRIRAQLFVTTRKQIPAYDSEEPKTMSFLQAKIPS